MTQGLTIKIGDGLTRVDMQCEHQKAILYLVPAEASWVCSEETRMPHSFSGFFNEISKLQDPRVVQLMRRWGISFRERPMEGDPA